LAQPNQIVVSAATRAMLGDLFDLEDLGAVGARLSGFDPAVAGEGKLLEHSTLTCSHCKCAVVKNPPNTSPVSARARPESVRLFADLMSVPLPEDRYPRPSMTA
jgi:hypothetical protein